MTQKQTNFATSVVLTSLLFGAIALTGCNQSIKVVEPTAQAVPVDTVQEIPAPPAWEPIAKAMNGKVDGSPMNGKLMVQVDPTNQALVFYLPLPLNLINFPVQSIDIPQLPGASIFKVDQPDGTTQIGVRVPLKYLLNGAQLAAKNNLPNGDPLPFMPIMGNIGVDIPMPGTPGMTLHFYMSANAAAAFIELPQIVLPDIWNMLKLGFPIKNAAKTEVVGYFAFVPNRSTFASGVYVAGRLPTQVADIIGVLIQ